MEVGPPHRSVPHPRRDRQCRRGVDTHTINHWHGRENSGADRRGLACEDARRYTRTQHGNRERLHCRCDFKADIKHQCDPQ